MVRKNRRDGIDTWHHVMNRGIAKRPLFVDEKDVRYFQSCLAREVRRGTLEIHAYSILMTHYHFLGRSTVGELPSAMMRVGQRYSRYANRKLRRDGALVRGRFVSKPVTTHQYRMAVVRYIDFNAVQAGLATYPWDYPYCSAAVYVHNSRQPWLTKDWVQGQVTNPGEWVDPENVRRYTSAAYMERFGRLEEEGALRLVERRILMNRDGPDELGDLLAATPDRVRDWMQRKTTLADGGRLGQPMVVAAAIEVALVLWPDSLDLEIDVTRGPPVPSKSVIRVGLLRHLVGMPWSELSREVNESESKCRRLCARHQRLVLHEPLYCDAAAEMTRRALDWTFDCGRALRRN